MLHGVTTPGSPSSKDGQFSPHSPPGPMPGSMSTNIQTAIDRGDYRVDPAAVANAILSRVRDLSDAPVIPSQVLVPVGLFDDDSAGADKVHALAADHGA